LPKAIRAPTPTSALVHSSTLVTAGLVVIMCYSEVLINKNVLTVLIFIGFITIVVGSLSALMEFRVKKIVAYSTISQMGLGVMVYGIGYLHLGYLNLIAHGLAKSLLFMQIGYLIHINYNQQNYRKWGFGRNIEGVLRVQLVCTLLSLRGLTYFRGILRKEAILERVNRGSYSTIILIFVSVRVYLTFVYSYLIYKVIFSSSISRTEYNQKRVVLMIVLGIEVILIISYFSWLMGNLISNHTRFTYGEVVIPFLVFLIIIIMFNSIININYIYNGIRNMIIMIRNYQHHV
jgi:NADH:ubiquinone oxidoreductase subunit 5 (subunit L)/multisubunit Na+/H+ antiporter MnhA subunit